MTIYILESHPLMCQAISFLLRRIDPTKKVVEVHAYSKLQAAMLINDLPEAFFMEPLTVGINGTASIKQIKQNYPNTPLIIFSSIPREEAELVCLNAGANLYIEKITPIQDVFELVRDYLGWDNELTFESVKAEARASKRLVKLSKRQKQLIFLIDEGHSNENIAIKLNISVHTVKVHLWRLYKKVGINSRTQLIKFSRDNGHL